MNRHVAGTTIIICSIMLPVAAAHLALGHRSLASLRPEIACLWVIGSIACALVGTLGALVVANGNEDDDDFDE